MFAEKNTNRASAFLSQPFPAGWFQSLPPLFVIAIAPLFAWLWVKLGKRNPSSTIKLSIGLLFGGVSFLILIPIAGQMGVSPIWLTMTYLLQTIGELCLSPVGLSAMTKLAPRRIGGLIMGVLYLSNSTGNYLGGRMASVSDSLPLPMLFGTVGMAAVVLAGVLALLNKPMKRLTAGAD